MASGAFKCSKCDRSFKMAAHLARHQRSHGGGARGPKAGRRVKKGPGRKMNRRGPIGGTRSGGFRASSLDGGAAQLLSQMQSYYSDLSSQRASLDTQIAGIENAISSIGGATPTTRAGARRGRGPGRKISAGRKTASGARPGSLKDTIVRVLSQRSAALTPKDIASSVIKAGYKTKNKDLNKAISNTLPQMNNIKRVGRGLYTV